MHVIQNIAIAFAAGLFAGGLAIVIATQIRNSRARREIRGLILALRALKPLVTKIQRGFYDAAMRHRRHAEMIAEKRAAARLAAFPADSAPIEEVHPSQSTTHYRSSQGGSHSNVSTTPIRGLIVGD